MSMGMDGTIDRKRLIFPALGELYDAIAPYSYAIIRFCAGVIVMPHGYMKLFGPMAAPVAQNVIAPGMAVTSSFAMSLEYTSFGAEAVSARKILAIQYCLNWGSDI